MKSERTTHETNDLILRETVRMEEQLKHQFFVYRNFWNAGDVKGYVRAGKMLFQMLRPTLSKKQLEKYQENFKETKTIEDYYTDEDKEDLEAYGELEDDRMRELRNDLGRFNQNEILNVWDKRTSLFTEVMNKIGLGFTAKEPEDVGADDELDNVAGNLGRNPRKG